MILAVVPARGASKRLPGKNVAPFCGRPLLAWSIALVEALGPDVRGLVSTDDPEIASVAEQCGAEVIARPPELAEDDSSIVDVLIHATQIALADGRECEGVMLLQPTSPLRPVGSVQSAIKLFRTKPCDSLMAVTRRRLKFGKVVDGYFHPDYVVGTQSRRTKPVFHESGWLYLTKTSTLLEGRSLTGDRVLAFEVERPFDEVDIDDATDLAIGQCIGSLVIDQLGY